MMTVLKKTEFLLVLLYAALCFEDVHGSCATTANIAAVQAIVTDLTTLLAPLPDPADLFNPTHVQLHNDLLVTLCTTRKSDLESIGTITAGCPQILAAVPALLTLVILGDPILTIIAGFSSIDEFCDCHTHLMSAWTVDNFLPSLQITDANMAVSPVSNITAYCTTGELVSVFDALVAATIASPSCPPIAAQAGIVDNNRITEIEAFIDASCSAFSQSNYECAITQSSTDADFKTCFANPPLVNNSTDCGKYKCIKDYIETDCGASGRETYILAVNLQRALTTTLIPTQDCEASANIVTMTTIVLAVSLLHLFI